MRKYRSILALITLTLVPSWPALRASACSRAAPFSFDELFAADVIVRATAVRYVDGPDRKIGTTSGPASAIEFKVEEVLKGEDLPETVVLYGYLSDRDDFNDVEAPYRFVRPDGRAGSCYANSYKGGAQFLLFLKKKGDRYTPDISPLGPTNEQLRGPGDVWLKWVRERLADDRREEKPEPPGKASRRVWRSGSTAWPGAPAEDGRCPKPRHAAARRNPAPGSACKLRLTSQDTCVHLVSRVRWTHLSRPRSVRQGWANPV